jgi:hypothetical protein
LGKALEYIVEVSVKCGELLPGAETASERSNRCRKDSCHRKFGAVAKKDRHGKLDPITLKVSGTTRCKRIHTNVRLLICIVYSHTTWTLWRVKSAYEEASHFYHCLVDSVPASAHTHKDDSRRPVETTNTPSSQRDTPFNQNRYSDDDQLKPLKLSISFSSFFSFFSLDTACSGISLPVTAGSARKVWMSTLGSLDVSDWW